MKNPRHNAKLRNILIKFEGMEGTEVVVSIFKGRLTGQQQATLSIKLESLFEKSLQDVFYEME